MIELGAQSLLQLILTIESVAMAIIAGFFLLLMGATKDERGRWWFRGWTLFAFALAAEAIGQRNAGIESAMAYVGTLLCIAAGYGAVAGCYEFAKAKGVALWVNIAVVVGAVAALLVTSRADLTADLIGPEVTLFVAMIAVCVAIYPFLRERRLSGVRPIFISALLLAIMMGRTLFASAVLGFQHAELNALYWSAEVVGGGILATMLAMGQLITLLDELRIDVEDGNAALSRALSSLEVAAKVDALTGLHNRYAFYTITDGLRNRGDRGNVVLLDLNNLKRINDTYGHHNGDRALLSVAQRLREVAGAQDYVFRWGGDEFVLLLFGLSPEETRDRVTRMEPPKSLDVVEAHEPVPLSVSWGIAPFNPLDVDGSLRQADAQLYAQKRLLGSAARFPR
jgi:diguanylate cyclase (GGDEF)-like protein